MRFSALAGSFAALAGVFGKLGADGDTSASHQLQTLCATSDSLQHIVPCAMLVTLVRAASIALMLASNAVMLHFFVKGLHETDSLTATVTSAATNFMLAAAAGRFFFHEHLPLQWFVGATLILVGMGCLLHGDAPVAAASKPKQS